MVEESVIMKKQYRFGQTRIAIYLPNEMLIPNNMSLFECHMEEPVRKTYYLEFTEDLTALMRQYEEEHQNIRKYMRRNMEIWNVQTQECRVVRFEGGAAPYAFCVEENQECSRAWISREVEQMLQYDTVFSSVLNLEKVILQDRSLILHSAFMNKDEQAILFSAPSGVGKSTQANLWEQYRGTRIINGDRSLLVKEKSGWYAYGWPICGSSEICHNEKFPIHAIVMLHQAKVNEVKRLGIFEAVKRLMSEITINMWNSEFQIKALDLIQELVEEVPVFELGCDISEDAVKCLEKVL